MIACHTRRRPVMCVAEGVCGQAMLNFIQLCVLPKGDDGMHTCQCTTMCTIYEH